MQVNPNRNFLLRAKKKISVIVTYLPDVGDDGEFLFSVLKAVLDELVEADRVDEEGAVDALDGLGLDARVDQDEAVDAVASAWFLVLGLQDHAWNVQVLRILQRLIDPRLEHLRTHLDLTVLGLEAGALRLNFLGEIHRLRHGLSCCSNGALLVRFSTPALFWRDVLASKV